MEGVFQRLLTRWKNVTIMEGLSADSELIGWVPRGQARVHSCCCQTSLYKRPEESAELAEAVAQFIRDSEALWMFASLSFTVLALDIAL